MTSFRIVYGREPPGLVPYAETIDDHPLVSQWLTSRDKVLSQFKSNLLKAQVRMKWYAYMKHSELQFQVEDWVSVKLQPYRQHSVQLRRNRKLGMKYFGPLRILEKVGTVAYRLKLPDGAKIHPVFHISLVKQCAGDPSLITVPLPLMSSSNGPVIRPATILQYRQVLRENRKIPRVLIQ